MTIRHLRSLHLPRAAPHFQPQANRCISATRVVQGIRRKTRISAQDVQTAEELRSFARTSSRKVPGSLSYNAAFRNWSKATIDLIRYKLSQNLPHPIDPDSSAALQRQLGVAADVGSMPSFRDPGSRAGYALDFFSRALLLADLLFHRSDTNLPRFFAERLDEILFKRGDSSSSCQLTSVGGGPGYDFVATALVTSFHAMSRDDTQQVTSIHATIFDYEEGWQDLVEVMNTVTCKVLSPDAGHDCTFGGKCDITKALTDPTNAACLAKVDSTDIWVFQYCVAENAALLRVSNFIFFAELARASKEGSLFVLTETTHRLWPELVQHIGDGFEVAFSQAEGRGKRGWQMLMRKKQGATISEEQLALCEKFQQDKEQHEIKIKRSDRRQAKE
jgi:hypothetical protein